MKNLRKMLVVVATLVMAFALTACGKEQSVTYRMEQSQSGITMVDEVTFDAKGDVIQKMTEKITMDTSALDDATREQINAVYDEMVAMYEGIEGVECTTEVGDTSYTMNVVIDTTGSAVEELSSMGLLEIEGSTDGISLKATQESFEATGYTLVE